MLLVPEIGHLQHSTATQRGTIRHGSSTGKEQGEQSHQSG